MGQIYNYIKYHFNYFLSQPWTSNLIDLISCIVLAITFWAIWRQLKMQTKTFNAQLVNSQFQMYWKTLDPITERQISELEVYPEDFIDRELYDKKYRDDTTKKHRYLWMMQTYEYLAFCWASIYKMKLPEPIGIDRFNKWLDDLIAEEEFIDVHNFHCIYYPEFSEEVEKHLKAIKNTTVKDAN